MTWDVFNIVGTIAFAISGAIVAMQEEYDLLGVYVLGFVTAFGGGIVRNLLIGVPVTDIWEQSTLFTIALLSMTIVFLTSAARIQHFKRWINFFDAIGLSAFAIQGASYANSMNHPVAAVIVAAVLTGIGGGVIRDLLARRKPLVLRDEIYAVWAILVGVVISFDVLHQAWQMYVLFMVVLLLRLLSMRFGWKLPRRKLPDA